MVPTSTRRRFDASQLEGATIRKYTRKSGKQYVTYYELGLEIGASSRHIAREAVQGKPEEVETVVFYTYASPMEAEDMVRTYLFLFF